MSGSGPLRFVSGIEVEILRDTTGQIEVVVKVERPDGSSEVAGTCSIDAEEDYQHAYFTPPPGAAGEWT